MAADLRVDDALFLSSFGRREEAPECDTALQKAADSLEQVGFLVKERRAQGEVDKIIGCELEARPAKPSGNTRVKPSRASSLARRLAGDS